MKYEVGTKGISTMRALPTMSCVGVKNTEVLMEVEEPEPARAKSEEIFSWKLRRINFWRPYLKYEDGTKGISTMRALPTMSCVGVKNTEVLMAAEEPEPARAKSEEGFLAVSTEVARNQFLEAVPGR